MNNSQLREYIQKLVKEMLEEDSTSADAGAYSTPKAFKKQPQLDETITKIVNEELLKEATYHQFKNETKFRTKSEQLNKAVREVKRKLQEVDKIVEYTSRLKGELNENGEGTRYWKATERHVGQISEIANDLSNKIKNLYQ